MDGREAAECDLVLKHVDEAAAFLANVWRQKQLDFMRFFPKNIESPLEAVFSVWWSAYLMDRASSGRVTLYQQYDVVVGTRKYRLDVALLPRLEVLQALEKHGIPLRAVAVELDGHEHHERTKEQAIKRNERDRWLQGAGWTVLHFSGSELNAKPVECVHQAVVHAGKLADEMVQAVIDKGGYEDVYQS
jgi:hypothetical protein